MKIEGEIFLKYEYFEERVNIVSLFYLVFRLF